MPEKKPIKRNDNLVVFSHEHHHGLVFCTRLRKAHLTDTGTIQNFVNDFWNKSLIQHFEAEEKLFGSLASGNQIMQRLYEEHTQIKNLLKSINNGNGNACDLAVELADVLDKHIRFEEREMFPWLEQTLDAGMLEIIGKALANTEIQSHTFVPEFWKNSTLGKKLKND